MTDQIFDDRAAAYVGARERLKLADQIKAGARREAIEATAGLEPAELPEEYWGAIAAAAVLAHLATADAAVGYLAGNHLVDQAQRIDRNKRRRIREDVHSRIQASAAAEGVTKHPNPVRRPPFAGGHTVKLTEGDWAGRTGQILETHLCEGEPTLLDVQLFPPGQPSNPAEPIRVTVRDDQAELVEL